MQTAADISSQRKMKLVAEIFLNSGVITQEDVLKAEKRSIALTLESGSTEDDMDEVVHDYIIEAIDWFTSARTGQLGRDAIDKDWLQGLGQSIEEYVWLTAPVKTQLRLRIWGITGVPSGEAESFPSIDRLLLLFKGRDTVAINAIADWLRAKPHPVDALVTLALARPSESSKTYTDAFNEAVAAVSTKDRIKLTQELLSEFQSSPLSSELLGIIAKITPDVTIADTLANRFSKCVNNAQRKAALDTWRACDIRSPQGRRLGIERVAIPMLSMNKQALEIALDYLFDLKPIPKELQRPVLSAAAEGASDDDRLKRKVTDTLRAIGFPTRKKGFFGFRTVEIDDSHEALD